MNVEYGMRIGMNGTFADVVERVTAALKTQGFGILTEIDVKATFKKKLDVDFYPYLILGACNPVLAHKAIQEEQEIGLLLPCNVIVYQDQPDSVMVSIVDPLTMLGMINKPGLNPIATEARERLENALAQLAE